MLAVKTVAAKILYTKNPIIVKYTKNNSGFFCIFLNIPNKYRKRLVITKIMVKIIKYCKSTLNPKISIDVSSLNSIEFISISF
jgi:hypothetical protein